MKKLEKGLALVLALVMIVSLTAVTAFADGTGLPDAVGDTITLTQNVTLDADVEISANTTLDLKGFTINTAGHTIRVTSGTLTVTGNGTVDNAVVGIKDNKNPSNEKPHQLFSVNSSAKLVIENGTYTSNGFQLIDIYGTCLIQDGTFKCNYVGDDAKKFDSKVILNVQGTSANLTMLKGSVTCSGSGSDGMYAIYVQEGGTVTLGKRGASEGPTINSFSRLLSRITADHLLLGIFTVEHIKALHIPIFPLRIRQAGGSILMV